MTEPNYDGALEAEMEDALMLPDDLYALEMERLAALTPPASTPSGEPVAWGDDVLVQAAWPTFDKEIGGTYYGLISQRDLEMICERVALTRISTPAVPAPTWGGTVDNPALYAALPAPPSVTALKIDPLVARLFTGIEVQRSAFVPRGKMLMNAEDYDAALTHTEASNG